MRGRLAKISNLYRDLADRYGPDDLVVQQLQEQLERRSEQVRALPFGERRKVNLPPHLWNQRLRPAAADARQAG